LAARRQGRRKEERDNMRIVIAAAVVAAASPASSPAWAHHGWGSYDANRVLTFEAKVIEASYGFPHGEVVMEAGGKRWRCILAPPSRMENRGLKKEAIAPGATIKVEGYPSKVHDDEMRVERVTVGGKTIEMR
jgi:hypothetical protein